MDKKDQARKMKRLGEIEQEIAACKSRKLKKFGLIAIDLIVLLAAIIIFFLLLFANPDMNYIPLLIVTCAVTGLSIVRAFGHGSNVTEINKEKSELVSEAESIQFKLEKMS